MRVFSCARVSRGGRNHARNTKRLFDRVHEHDLTHAYDYPRPELHKKHETAVALQRQERDAAVAAAEEARRERDEAVHERDECRGVVERLSRDLHEAMSARVEAEGVVDEVGVLARV